MQKLLTQEVAYIEQYIELQKIRTSNADFVKFETAGNLGNLYIAPMLFIPFIENAFKHGTDKKATNAIEINITAENNSINFTCSNLFNPSHLSAQPNSGLGLELISSRLNLLYKAHHHLVINETGNRFTITLSIQLNDN